MKIYLGKYRDHWLSPYTIAEKLCWWREIDYDERWVVWLEKLLNPVMDLIRNVLDKIHPEIHYVKIDRWDTWSMDYALGQIILPMLKQLKATTHGYPSGLTEKKWHKILDKMIWSFEQVVAFYPDDEFWLTKPELDWDNENKPDKQGLREFKWKVEGVCDWEGMKRHNQKVDEGLRLFGIYFRALWD